MHQQLDVSAEQLGQTEPMFLMGKLYATPAVLAALEEAGVSVLDLLARHVRCDSDMCPSDLKANRDAVPTGSRIFSAYRIAHGVKVFVVTEASRELTTVLLAEQY